MWPKVLSWVALAANVAAVLFNMGLGYVVMADSPAGLSTRIFEVSLLTLFFLAAPTLAVATLASRSSIARGQAGATARSVR